MAEFRVSYVPSFLGVQIIYGENTTDRGIDCDNEESAEPLLELLYRQTLKDITIHSNQ
jgi:hypothetical protein